MKILDLCGKASLPANELKAEDVAQIIRETYLNATIKNKKVTVIFREPFATIENLVKRKKTHCLISLDRWCDYFG